MKSNINKIILTIIGLCVYFIFAFGSSDNNDDSKTIKKQTIEYQLAVINAGGPVKSDNPTINRFKYLIKAIDGKFPENEQQIGDMSVTGMNLLTEAGIPEKLLTIMEGMNKLEASNNMKYSECIAGYVTLRKDGQSHSEAILNYNALIKSMLG